MYAVIKTGGKQYIVREGQILRVEKLDRGEGESIEFSALFLRGKNCIKVGEDARKVKVKATVLRHGKGKKIIVFKYKPKKHYQRKYGHRQQFTEIRIDRIEGDCDGS